MIHWLKENEGKDATSYFTKPEACDCASRERSERIHQGEGGIEKALLQDGVLFSTVSDIHASVRVRVDSNRHD